ncbi:MAG: hypothetical protein N2235_16995 [Fischerella sp.]|nr:hypothetical protein [Fischerella sp.]
MKIRQRLQGQMAQDAGIQDCAHSSEISGAVTEPGLGKQQQIRREITLIERLQRKNFYIFYRMSFLKG